MKSFRSPKLALGTLAVGLALAAIFGVMLLRFRADLHGEIRRTVIGRDAAVLRPVARQQLMEAESRAGAATLRTEQLLAAVLANAQRDGVLALAVFDPQAGFAGAVPGSLLFAEITAPDYITLLGGTPISRFHAALPLSRYFAGADAAATAPVLEVLFPLEGRVTGQPLGFAQYYLDARALSAELDAIEQRLWRQTLTTFSLGSLLLVAVGVLAYLGNVRAQRLIAERNARLARANFELTLAAKASALGQITSHLMHGLQGSVAGLRAAVTAGPAENADWESAVHYTEHMQALISEVVALLGDARTGARYELSGADLAGVIRERAAPAATRRGVRLLVDSRLNRSIDSQRGSLLCLIAANLVDNAIAATPPGATVSVHLAPEDGGIVLAVIDEGTGINGAVRERLFEPGATTRPGGTGLGLAISRLLARQIGGELDLVYSHEGGTKFQVRTTC
ncbi:MAG: hypothetical protein C0518_10155 [Opitutus sp.]|nr:hypothetical protein [Opitutus sp.]